ncbi:MAG: DUF2330 domain-containing protein [Planctomycetaceae bacterium]|nr:DUF2330 domain-containing protein [Planctomycetaceae bacterium]MBT6487047.1 DUF2330 domain-containing protein [Planctomycetaceae bacterium]MBT6495664.1 DUF2330 domain-containing protein [Planctomycetaceae bacterium]
MLRLQKPVLPLLAVLTLVLPGPQPAWSDPCGMVPPIDIPLAQQDGTPPIVRVGVQMTYVFYKNGIETFVIRPGFEGKTDEFGMLIPFPTPPEIRKVPDEIFAHIAAAIDPPEVELDLRPQVGFGGGFGGLGGGLGGVGGIGGGGFGGGLGMRLKKDVVRVVREEAVGMYEVAVLEAGSAAALKKWMDDHGYRFPDGMQDVCNDYIRKSWGFVAVKSKVGRKAGVDPKPGMRKVNPNLPDGATFDGHVQAMGFRFRSRRLEVPMRLSAFNKGPLHNIIYLLSDDPAAVRSIGINTVVRQVPGLQLKRNLTQPLPVRLLGAVIKRGRITNLTRDQLKALKKERNPAPKNGVARELFESDLLAVRKNRLSHPSEESEKQLLQISERLGLRGDEVDAMHKEEMTKSKQDEAGNALDMLNRMTLTVIDGDLPRKVLARDNLTFYRFKMRTSRNSPRYYDANLGKGTKRKAGLLLRTANLDAIDLPDGVHPSPVFGNIADSNRSRSQKAASLIPPVGWTAAFITVIVMGVVAGRRRRNDC